MFILRIPSFILANALPMSIDFYRNDGAVIYGILKQDDSTKVAFSLMKIQSKVFLCFQCFVLSLFRRCLWVKGLIGQL